MDLAKSQFGCRRGHFSVDVIVHVRVLRMGDAGARGGVVLAVSLEIANVINTLPWRCIRGALWNHRMPPYLYRVVDAYLMDRAVIYPSHQEEWNLRDMSCVVPQRSVVGPYLWGIGYDWALSTDLPSGFSMVSYADDTLVLTQGRLHQAAAEIATRRVAAVVKRIQQLGLEVALHKSEAMCFHDPRNVPSLDAQITVGEVHIIIDDEVAGSRPQ